MRSVRSRQEVRQLIQKLLLLDAQTPQQLQLAQPLDLESAFLDTTCLVANIHYPVDWVLLRDATRTLMKAVRERLRARCVLGRQILAKARGDGLRRAY